MMNKHNARHLKKDKQRINALAWHSARYWDWCLPEDEKKAIEPTFADKNGKCLKLVEGVKILLERAISIR